jgi:hypothetical protein
LAIIFNSLPFYSKNLNIKRQKEQDRALVEFKKQSFSTIYPQAEKSDDLLFSKKRAVTPVNKTRNSLCCKELAQSVS